MSKPSTLLTEDTSTSQYRCVDFFCGIGGFHIAATNLGLDVVFACDIDEQARRAYSINFNIEPSGDVRTLKTNDVPDHDLLFAGFPCQPFSIIGQRKGFSDPRGNLFFEILRFLRAKNPRGIVLENVKQIATAQGGSVMERILKELRDIGYCVDYKVLNALNFGLPQKRERVIIVGTKDHFDDFPWPEQQIPMKPLGEVLEESPAAKYYASQTIREKRRRSHTAKVSPAIWHENKAGNISSYPWSCALRANASYNYLLVDGKRRLTPRELLRLQGFPDSFKIVCSDSQTRKQAGNAVPVPLVQSVIQEVIRFFEKEGSQGARPALAGQQRSA